MEDKKLQNGIKEIKEISMTRGEKERIYKNVLNSPLLNTQPVLSPWIFIISKFKTQNTFIRYGIPAFLFVILVSGGSIVASQKSLPGDVFYPIKVSVVEKVNGIFALSPEKEALYQTELANKRFAEAEILMKRGELDENKEEKINKLLEKNISKINKTINTINLQNKSENIDNVVANFEAEIKAHSQVLDLINYEKREVKKDFQISKKVQEGAEKIKDNLKNNQKDSEEKYIKKKEEIEKRIESTSINLEEEKYDDKSDIEEKIKNDTNTNLNRAKEFLEKADKNKKSGNAKDAYSYLIDSESSSKQAEIFLKSSIKFKKENTKKEERDRKKIRD